mgnify:CR=1 FL=1
MDSKPFKRYTINNPDAVRELIGDEASVDWKETIKAAGFDPDDEELAISHLARDWNGHQRGALVVHGLLVEGHPFAIN